MLHFLAKKLIPNYNNMANAKVQADYIALSGGMGLAINLFLFFLKLIIGTLMNSIAIQSDAFNNLSDSLSSIVTYFGSYFSKKPADENHPEGHGRFEYVASLVVSMIILYVGLELMRSSIQKVIEPEALDFHWGLFAILIFSIFLKVYMVRYNQYLANTIRSPLNEGVAKDSRNDVIATTGLVVTTMIAKWTGWNLDGFAGVIISLLVLKSGLEFAKDTISILLGEKPDEELCETIERLIMEGKYVRGYHDLKVHNYGRGRVLASVHVEIPMDIGVVEIHDIIDSIERKVMKETEVELVIHMDPSYQMSEWKEEPHEDHHL